MRGLRPYLVIVLALVAAMLSPPGSKGQSAANEQNNSVCGTLVIVGKGTGGWLPNVGLTLRVHSVRHAVDLTMTVENLTRASFEKLPPDEYLLEVSAEGYPPAQLEVAVDSRQSVGVTVEVNHGSPAGLSVRLSGATKTEVSTTQARAVEGAGPEVAKKRAECAVENVITATSTQVQGFVENVNRISATEVLEHERLNRNGKVVQHEHRKFNYVVTIEETMPGELNVEEYRDGSSSLAGFPGEIATVGMPSLALIFHPYHVKEFNISCEGMEEWQGRPVWKVRFEQRMDKPATMSVLQVGGMQYAILLKGKAWIDVENYQIVHLETDLMRPIPEVKLSKEHQALDYGPVQFQQKGQRLWLPLEAEIYVDAGGKQFHHRHAFSEYRIFSVDAQDKVGNPKTGR